MSGTHTLAETPGSDSLTSPAMLDHRVLSSAPKGFPSFSTQEVQVHLPKPTQLDHLSESVSTDPVSRESAMGPSSQWLSAPDAALTTGPTSGPSFLSVSCTSRQSVGAPPSMCCGTRPLLPRVTTT